MHEYSTGNRNSEKVVFRIALIAFIITPGINYIISLFTDILGNYIEITYTVSSILVFSILYFFFNKFLWRCFTSIIKIPDLNGTWKCKGHSKDYKNKNEFDWESEIFIKQEWNKISIIQHTKKSDSFSTSIIGGLRLEDNGEVLLSYVYSNDPRNINPNLSHHEGLAKVRFNKELNKANGDYFNDQIRQTYGTMSLEKTK